jgi:hypothetical protein
MKVICHFPMLENLDGLSKLVQQSIQEVQKKLLTKQETVANRI